MADLGDFAGIDRVKRRLQSLKDVDASPLMERWKDILVEGNRRGVLAGLDGKDQPMPPLQYRNGAGKNTANRQAREYGRSRYQAVGGSGANLTTKQYRQLTGPRLAPRREASRVIKNLQTETRYDAAADRWTAVAAWRDVVSKKNVHFLPFHFDGLIRSKKPLPKYDLRPVRERDRKFALNALRAFVKEVWNAAKGY